MGFTGNDPGGGDGAKSPKAEGLFLNLRYEKTISWHFCFKQSLTKYSLLCYKAFVQRNKPGLNKDLFSKMLYS